MYTSVLNKNPVIDSERATVSPLFEPENPVLCLENPCTSSIRNGTCAWSPCPEAVTVRPSCDC
jgi:hypothetical protein